MTKENIERLVAGGLTDLAIASLVFGIVYKITPLTAIGVCGFFLACSPALMAPPLMWVFGLYVAIQPLMVLAKYIKERRK